MKRKAPAPEQVAELLCGDNTEAIFIIRQVLSMNGIDNNPPSLNRAIGKNRARSGLSNPQNTQQIITT